MDNHLMLQSPDCVSDLCACLCSICNGDSEKLRIYKEFLVCEECLDYIKGNVRSEEH